MKRMYIVYRVTNSLVRAPGETYTYSPAPGERLYSVGMSRKQTAGFRIQGLELGIRVEGLVFRVLGFRVLVACGTSKRRGNDSGLGFR